MTTKRDKRFCGGKKRRSEETCTRPAGWGTSHPGWGKCKLHGGSAPSSVKAAEVAYLASVERDARTLFGKELDEARPVLNPLAVYAEFAGQVMAWMKLLDKLLDDLRSPRYSTETGEQIRGEVQLFERAMDRCNAVLSSYARLKIDERLAQISEQQKTMVIGAIERALAAAGVTGSAAAEAKKVAARHLRVVDAA